MGRGIITASRTACLRAEHEVASRGEKCARLFSVGSEIAKNRFRDPNHSLPGGWRYSQVRARTYMAQPCTTRQIAAGADYGGAPPETCSRRRAPP